MEIKELVISKLTEYPDTRNNDNLLIAMVMEDLYGTSNLYDIAKHSKKNRFESIRRARQDIQAKNPSLKANDVVVQARREKEKRMRERYAKW